MARRALFLAGLDIGDISRRRSLMITRIDAAAGIGRFGDSARRDFTTSWTKRMNGPCTLPDFGSTETPGHRPFQFFHMSAKRITRTCADVFGFNLAFRSCAHLSSWARAASALINLLSRSR